MAFDFFLLFLAFLLIGIGIGGSFLPALPGPPLAYLGLWVAHFTDYAPFSIALLIVYGLVVVLVTIMDYLLPMWATRLSGGTKAGARGATIGTLIGIAVPIPFGIFLGAFIGAYLGELYAGKNKRDALTAGLGAFAGFITGSLLKALFCLAMGLHLIVELI